MRVRRFLLITDAEVETLREDEEELDGDDLTSLPNSRQTMCAACTHIEGKVDAREQSCYGAGGCEHCVPEKLDFQRCKRPGSGPMVRCDILK